MTLVADGLRAEAFFLPLPGRQLFCLFHPAHGECRGAVLYVPPFAEEMNRARRIAAQQARELAALGYGVLQPDLDGTGDSSGDFGDARWETWKDDLAACCAWLGERIAQPPLLWGLRLGALLALDYAQAAAHPLRALILWQPVASGQVYLTQFLRMRTLNAVLADSASEQTGTRALRAALQSGVTLEVGGYTLDPALAAAIDALTPLEGHTPPCPVHWFEMAAPGSRALPPGAARAADAWRRRHARLQVHAVDCPPFWAAGEGVAAPALLAATTALLREDRLGD
ncbi:hydrolase 2, exosortase A system-associated [Massilia varians]|uniref:hydrolase 2, exosortase A system-associated n=1 Tax=Massilia varians TaxID=457921 RepID=UPI0025579582|nr:hydrolase 2, exosortase A system-associated [Massilia varians]MDK6078669.1 hydrolase 2, exosortase A system-associated [Massilia varians]